MNTREEPRPGELDLMEDGWVDVPSPLPIGAVTLLMTDIEGSTPLWEAGRDIAVAALARHRELLHAAVALHGGVRPVEQGEGDSVVAAFANPSDALAAALDAQRALREEPWPEGAAIKIRVGVHSGEIALRDPENYHGPTIIRAARLRDLGHGGQTLLSSTTKDLVADDTADGVTFRDLGICRLKGLNRAERVWQLCHPELEREFPPLRTSEITATNLPVPTTSFVGREDELAEMLEAIGAHRLLSLCGAGGCGKTRLALELAGQLTESHPGGAWWVELASVSNVEHVASALADSLSVREVHDEAVLDTVAGELHGRDAVVVLDNCEQVLDGAARVVDALLRAVPDLRVITTSREPLGIAGELAWRVPSLEDAAAVDLFVDRAAAVRVGYAPGDEERDVIAQICRRLDGVPLAVELAAARVRMMHPRRIAAGLDDRFRILTGGSRTAMPRQQTLEASVEWSHQLLDDVERAVLRRLSVFAGGFTVEAAEAVCSGDVVDPYAVLDVLTRLVDKSLVQVDIGADDARYRLLETIRQFGRDRLVESGDGAATRDRHLEFFVAAAEEAEPQLQRADGVTLLRRYEIEHDNLRVALDWAESAGEIESMLRLATALTLFWELRGHLAEGCRWFARALSHDADRSTVHARALWGAAHVAVYNEDHVLARELAGRAVKMAAEFGDAWAEARALNSIGYATALWGPDDARPLLERSIALGRRLSDDWVIADGLKMLTIDHFAQDDLDALEQTVVELREVAEALDNGFFLAWADAVTGYRDLRRGDFDAARTRLIASIERCHDVGDPATGGIATAWLGEVEARSGDVLGGRSRIDEFMAHANATGGHLGTAHATLTLAEVMLGGTEQEGARMFGAAMAASLSFRALKAHAGIVHGAACRVMGDLDAAQPALDAALEVAWDAGNDWAAAYATHELGLLSRARGESSEAERLLHAALALRHRHGLAPGVAETLEALAVLAADHESHAEAARLLGAAAALRDRIGLARWAAPQGEHDANVERIRTAVGDDAFTQAWREGEALDVDSAVAYVSRARGERRRPSVGWASLTPTEERVVMLVAEGLTNPQIAERLFIARGTVKAHLGHVFTKLDVSTRAELAAEATRRSS